MALLLVARSCKAWEAVPAERPSLLFPSTPRSTLAALRAESAREAEAGLELPPSRTNPELTTYPVVREFSAFIPMEATLAVTGEGGLFRAEVYPEAVRALVMAARVLVSRGGERFETLVAVAVEEVVPVALMASVAARARKLAEAFADRRAARGSVLGEAAAAREVAIAT